MPRLRMLLALVALAGCGGEALPAACSMAGECPPPSPSAQWAAQLFAGSADMTRPGGEALLPQDEPHVAFGPGGLVQLRFNQPAHLRGVVFDENSQPVALIRVIAVLPSALPGQSPQSFETSTDPGGSFELIVPVPRDPPSQPYRLWVGFDDQGSAAPGRPPLWQDGVVVRGDTQVSLQLPRLAALAALHGSVVDVLGHGVAGMRVQVVDTRREVVSSTATTTAAAGAQGGGEYDLLIDPLLTTDSHLQLLAWPTQPGSSVPVLTLPIDRPSPGDSLVADLRVPAAASPQPFTLTVSGTGPSGATLAVAGAQVQAQVFLPDTLLPESDQVSTYIATGETDDNGQVTLPLVPATGRNLQYTVSVQSPADSPLSSAVVPVQVGGEPGYITLPPLPLRAQISGRLLDSRGHPVATAQLVARPINDGATPGVSIIGGVALPALMPQATADDNGRFAMWLDQGDYDVDIVPVPGTEPRWTLDNLRILTDDIELGFIRLPRPTLGRAVVMGPDGYPVNGALLRIFQLADLTPRPGVSCDGVQPCSHAARLRAEITTDDQGRAQFVLPEDTAY